MSDDQLEIRKVGIFSSMLFDSHEYRPSTGSGQPSLSLYFTDLIPTSRSFTEVLGGWPDQSQAAFILGFTLGAMSGV